jgi:hypothetical protein
MQAAPVRYLAQRSPTGEPSLGGRAADGRNVFHRDTVRQPEGLLGQSLGRPHRRSGGSRGAGVEHGCWTSLSPWLPLGRLRIPPAAARSPCACDPQGCPCGDESPRLTVRSGGSRSRSARRRYQPEHGPHEHRDDGQTQRVVEAKTVAQPMRHGEGPLPDGTQGRTEWTRLPSMIHHAFDESPRIAKHLGVPTDHSVQTRSAVRL